MDTRPTAPAAAPAGSSRFHPGCALCPDSGPARKQRLRFDGFRQHHPPGRRVRTLLSAALALCLLCALPEGCASIPPASSTAEATSVSAAVTTNASTTAPTAAPATNSTTAAAAFTVTAAPTTAPAAASATQAADARSMVRAALISGKVAELYDTTLASLFSRVNADGYLQESVTGRYKGEYVRSVGALVRLALEAGQEQAAGRALRFVTDTVKRHSLPCLPFTISADGKTVRREDELDGRAHFVLGWALYALRGERTAYEDDTYALMAREVDAFFSDQYFDKSAAPSGGLVRNRRFTHTRDNSRAGYWDCYDLLTNHFTAAAAEQMIAVARRRGDTAAADRWTARLAELAEGIRTGLTRESGGVTVYREMLVPSSSGVTAENRMSWVCLSPPAAGWSGMNEAVMANTERAAAQALRRRSADGSWYLAVEQTGEGRVKDWVLGKAVGWDIDAARAAGNWSRIADWFAFLEGNHAGSLYMETMKKSAGKWVLGDCGNAEQCIWFVWALARLRAELGLPVTG